MEFEDFVKETRRPEATIKDGTGRRHSRIRRASRPLGGKSQIESESQNNRDSRSAFMPNGCPDQARIKGIIL